MNEAQRRKKAKESENARRSIWLIDWINQHYPQDDDGATFDRKGALEGSFSDMRLSEDWVPDYKALVHEWWVREFNRTLKRNGYGFPRGNQGTTIVRSWMLPWDEFRSLMVDKLRSAVRDRNAIRRQVKKWAKCNEQQIDIEETMLDLLHAAGLEERKAS
jgi:hypothetical protein